MPANLITAAEASDAWSGFTGLSAGRQASVLQSASAAVSAACNRVLGFDVHDEVHRALGSRIIRLNQYPVVSLVSVETGPAAARTLAAADTYALLRGGRTGEIELIGYSYGDVRVVYEAGYVAEADADHPERPVCPAELKEAAILTLANLGVGMNTVGLKSEELGEYSYTLADSQTLTAGVPPGTEWIIGLYRRKRFV